MLITTQKCNSNWITNLVAKHLFSHSEKNNANVYNIYKQESNSIFIIRDLQK
jgi:hypothetical protein